MNGTHRRRWFQFSLRTLLALVTLAVVLLVAWRVYVEPYRFQRETMALIEELDGRYEAQGAEGWLRWMYGEDYQHVVLADVADSDDPRAYVEALVALPRLRYLIVGGPMFGDEQLARFRRLEMLEWVLLDSTRVSDDGIARLKEALPDLAVYRSDRRAVSAILELGGNLQMEACEILPKVRPSPRGHRFTVAWAAILDGPRCMARVGELSRLRWLWLRARR